MTGLKSIVLGLALANVGYFLWVRGIGAPRAVAVAEAPAMTLKLASEAPAAHPAADLGAASVSDAAAGSLTDAGRCVTVGPFRDGSEAAHALGTLRGGGYDPRQRVVDGDAYWIDIDLKPTDGPLNPADLQREAGRIQRLELNPCPLPPAPP